MGVAESVRTCFGKYADFQGRASRSEFWWFFLFTALVSLALSLPLYVLMVIVAVAGNSSTGAGVAAVITIIWAMRWMTLSGRGGKSSWQAQSPSGAMAAWPIWCAMAAR